MKVSIHNTILAFFAIVVISGCRQQGQQSEAMPIKTIAEEQADSSTTTDTAISFEPVASVSKPAYKHVGRVIGSKMVTNTNPDTITADNVTLLIDSGAVSRDVEISIVSTTEEHSGEIPAYMENLTADGAVYRMLPDGQKFDKDITIVMRYDSTALPFGYTPDDIYTFFYNEQAHMWQQVERDSVDTRNQIVYSRTNHFTDYINGVLKVPENSDVTAYTPTTIKDLKAADPMEGITLIAPPEANNQGTANLTYPLTIPAGRHGMQPQLSVTYNSAGGSGILGLGWSLPISEISVDTRRGVPLFNDTLETETYTIDGEVLVTPYIENGLVKLNKPAYRSRWKARNTTSSEKQFYPRVEGSFRRIIRRGTTPMNYTWEVTDKSGTKYYYGTSNASCLKDDSGNIVRWCLTRVVDTYGNEMRYTYTTRPYSALNISTTSRQILVSNINYTAFDPAQENGRYDIEFVYADSNKKDAITSARYGFLEADAALLDHINVKFDGNTIKHYVFGYKYGAYGKTLLGSIIEAVPDVFSHTWTEGNGITDTGHTNYRETEYIFSGDSNFFDSIDSVRTARLQEVPLDSLGNIIKDSITEYIYPDTNRFLDLSISTDSDYYSDHSILNRIVNTSIFSRDVYDRCTQMDSSCMFYAYNEHKFSYSPVPSQMLSETVYITNYDDENDNVGSPLFLVPMGPGPIEGSGTRSWNVGGAVTAGFGWDTFIKSFSLGGSYAYSSSKSEGLISLIDLNGDGFTDKIFKRNGTVYYRLRDIEDYTKFYAEESPITGISDFLRTTSSGDSWGIEGSVGVGGLGVCFGANWSDGNSATTTYFSDMDGDGLPDLVQNGCVYYNRIYESDAEIFVPVTPGENFVLMSSTCDRDTMFIGESIEPSLFSDFVDTTVIVCDTVYKGGAIYSIDCHPYRYTFPHPYQPDLENVRFWMAPYSGYVHITDSARMQPSATGSSDGVRLLVQCRDTIISPVYDTLLPDTLISFMDTVIRVDSGDCIYFRTLSMNSRTADRLMWNPTIAYCTSPEDSEAWDTLDDIGLHKYIFSYENDFLLSGLQEIKIPFDSRVRIEASAFDRTGYPDTTTVLEVLLNGNQLLTIDINNDVQTRVVEDTLLNKEDSIQVRVVASGPIDWSAIESHCRIYITHNNASGDDAGYACVDTLSYLDSTIYFFDYYPQIQKLVYKDSLNKLDSVYMYGNYSSSCSKFGTMYRNWGQFGYKKPAGDTSDLLREDILVVDDLAHYTDPNAFSSIDTNAPLIINTESPETSSTIGGIRTYNPLASSFFVMQPDFKNDCWTAFSDYAYIERGMLSNLPHPTMAYSMDVDSTVFESIVPIPSPNAVAVNKLSFNKSFGLSGNVSAKFDGFGWSGSASFTESETRHLADMIDLNGDGFPDVLSETRVQYTNPFGGLSTKSGSIFMDQLYTEYSHEEIHGGAYGGSSIIMKETPANGSRKATKSIVGNVGTNISGTSGESNSATTWVDINGDGLPDKVYCSGDNLYYYQNIGYGFLPRAIFSSGCARHSSSLGSSGSGSFGPPMLNLLENVDFLSELNVSITAGLGLSSSSNATDVQTIDLNGDGLPDRLIKSGNGYEIQFNNGNGFGEATAVLIIGDGFDNYSYTTDLTAAFSVGVTFGFIPLKIEVNPKGGLSRSLSSTQAQWMDMDADGIPDYIWDAGNGSIGVKYSYLGTANRLTSVDLPSGGQYNITYAINDHDGQESNMRHCVMTSLTVKDKRLQCPDQKRRFEYENRQYDRVERDDYGYSDVIIIEDSANVQNYRRTIKTFHNENYILRGLCRETKVVDGNTYQTLSEEHHDYGIFEIVSGDHISDQNAGCLGDGYPAILSSEAIYYDNGQPRITTRLRFGYTSYGNIDTVYDDGALNDPYDDYIAVTTYDSVGDYIVSAVTDERVSQGNTTYRHRSATHNPVTGSITTLTFHEDASDNAVYNLHYDSYGNVDTIIYPVSNSNQHFFVAYEYDSIIHSLPTSTSNAYGLKSYATYCYEWQKPCSVTSANDAIMSYIYDGHGRLKDLYGPLEYGTDEPTIRYDYYNSRPNSAYYWDTCKLWAKTLNKNVDTNYICTVTISDGLGRPRIVKKDASVGGQPMRIVGGWTEFDALGRKIREYYPYSEDTIFADTTVNLQFSTLCTQFHYDKLDRVTKTIYPDGTFSTSDYSIGFDADSILRLKVVSTDQNGHPSMIFSNVREQNTTITNPVGATTVFRYDNIGQLTKTISPDGDSTVHVYDMLGRRTDRMHPSAGRTHWDYDATGNMVRQSQNNGEWIAYKYDYLRPVKTEYSNRPWNNVSYKYGGPDEGAQAGRVVIQNDATGVQVFKYDKMGNVVYNRHTYVQPHCSESLTLTTLWEYDSWGRVLSIIYPDRDTVRYHYDFGGNLQRIDGNKNGHEGHSTYIQNIYYNLFGQRTYEVDGDNITTRYWYDNATRRLQHMSQYRDAHNVLQDITYVYDSVGNIRAIHDTGHNNRNQSYTYDSADRLTRSWGTISNEYSTGCFLRYTTRYSYSPAGKLLGKYDDSKRLSTALGIYTVSYDNTYDYGDHDNPYAVTRIRDEHGADHELVWDANGNLAKSFSHDAYRSDRRLCWTEDNRLQAYREKRDDGEIAAYYNYSADGERNFKLTSPRMNMQQNARIMSAPTLLYPTLYASSLVTLSRHGYTKHYFEEGRRICSKIGGGLRGNVTAEEIDDSVPGFDYRTMADKQRYGIRHTFAECQEREARVSDEFNLRKMLVEFQIPRDEPEPALFYHSDHLGSTAYVTYEGDVVQTLNYLPYGEDWVEINTLDHFFDTTNIGIYRFNGKEKDWESGFHYYGARYYWSEILTGWLSVDPMVDKYPSISPYTYCVWNPVRVVDPDGQDGWDKVAGFCIGVLTNVSPRTGWIRDAYIPTSSSDYNNSLRTADNTMMIAGGLMTAAGTAGVAAGATIIGSGGAVAATGVGIPEGAAVAATGVVVEAASVASGLIGSAVTMQATSNASQGYNRGGVSKQEIKPGSKTKSIAQLQNDVKSGRAPKSMIRFDKGKIKGEQDHVHFKDGSALNKDGSWKHPGANGSQHKLTNQEKKYLRTNGWKTTD